jgi:two-component system sensor histidine kinase KdpD
MPLPLPQPGQSCNIHEQVLVCVSTYSDSVQLLRRGARIADYMNARLYTLFVADPVAFSPKKKVVTLKPVRSFVKSSAVNSCG